MVHRHPASASKRPRGFTAARCAALLALPAGDQARCHRVEARIDRCDTSNPARHLACVQRSVATASIVSQPS